MDENSNTLGLNNCDDFLFNLLCNEFLSAEEMEIIKQSSIVLKYQRGEAIIKQGARSTHIAFLSKGVVKHVYEDETGRKLILAISSAPNLIGGANMFYNGKNAFTIFAVEECQACLIDISALKQVILMNSQFALKLFEVASDMFHDAIFNFISLAHKHVNGRVADIFIYLSRSIYKSGKFTLSLTRKELSEFAGVSQENVITTLSKFKHEGVISVEGKNIEILDFDKLTQISKIG
jgi:CRP/FNR family transcriptional regulator, polysaccharide utilization system transcription regulator